MQYWTYVKQDTCGFFVIYLFYLAGAYQIIANLVKLGIQFLIKR